MKRNKNNEGQEQWCSRGEASRGFHEARRGEPSRGEASFYILGDEASRGFSNLKLIRMDCFNHFVIKTNKKQRKREVNEK